MAIDEHSAEILKREVALVLKIKLFDKFLNQFKFLNCGFSSILFLNRIYKIF